MLVQFGQIPDKITKSIEINKKREKKTLRKHKQRLANNLILEKLDQMRQEINKINQTEDNLSKIKHE
jgi:methionyl-tRNA formyltransferase